MTGYLVQYSSNKKTWTTLKTTSASARSYTTKKGTKGEDLALRVPGLLNSVGLTVDYPLRCRRQLLVAIGEMPGTAGEPCRHHTWPVEPPPGGRLVANL